MAQHGAEMHFLRPDSVYITTVLQPTLNFDPVRDTAATAARFVAPVGLAGPVGYAHRPLGYLRAAPTWRERWQMFKARLTANAQTNRFMQDMRIKPMALPPGMNPADLPRPPNANPRALAVQGAWAPGPQSPTTAAMTTVQARPSQGDPPNQGPEITAVAMSPEQAAWPANFWRRVIQEGFPPVVSSRAEQAALTKWFGVKSPTGAGY